MLSLAMMYGCTTTPDGTRPVAQAATPEVVAPAKEVTPTAPRRSLASFRKSNTDKVCYDRSKEPFTAVVDAHFHARPFGGEAIPPTELFDYFDRLGVRFVNYFGIGQILELNSGCTYYLDCPGVRASPSIKNDFVNGMDAIAYKHPNLHITLSMTFMDLAHPQDAEKMIALYDREYPGMFSWSGELNVMKQALLGNLAEPATEKSIDAWAPFMKVLRERNIPVTLHADLGNDEHPTKYLHLMQHVLARYPNNKIIWAHMGLSKELSHMNPEQHVAIMKAELDRYPNLMLDISWDVLFLAYHEWGSVFIPFFNAYSTRILPGTDFVASRNKDFNQYRKELETTSRALRVLDDNAFRNIALGENYFRLMGLDYEAPPVCKSPASAAN